MSDDQMSTAARVASGAGLFLLGAAGVPMLLLLGAYLLVFLDVDSGGAAIAILFGGVGLPLVALARSRPVRPLAIGGFLGLAVSAAAVFFYVVVLKAGDF